MKKITYICDACKKEAEDILSVGAIDLCGKCAREVDAMIRKPLEIDMKEVMRLRKEGLTIKEIADELGTSYNSIQRRLVGTKKIDLQEEEILALYKDGYSCSEIGEKLGYDYHLVSKLLKKLGVLEPGRKPTKGSFYLDDKEVAGLYKDGLSVQEIAKKLKCSESGVKTSLDRTGTRKIKKRGQVFVKPGAVRAMAEEGWTTEEIASELKISEQAVSTIAKGAKNESKSGSKKTG